MAVAINSELANIPSVALTEQAGDLAAPSAGYAQLYVKAGLLYVRNAAGIFVPLYNPMTTPADLIVGAASGAPARLGKGDDGQVLTVDPSTHLLVWATPVAGSVATDAIWNTAGDLAVGSGANTAANLAKGSDSQVLSVDPGDHVVKWMDPTGGQAGALTRIAQTVVAGSPAAYIEFTAIPATYEELMITFQGRSNDATSELVLRMRLNSDSGSNYDQILTVAAAGTITASQAHSATAWQVGWVPGTTRPANYPSSLRLYLPGYARTVFNKTFHSECYILVGTSDTSNYRLSGSGSWANTSAISTVRLYPAAGSFIVDSIATLYGIA